MLETHGHVAEHLYEEGAQRRLPDGRQDDDHEQQVEVRFVYNALMTCCARPVTDEQIRVVHLRHREMRDKGEINMHEEEIMLQESRTSHARDTAQSS